MVDKQAVWDFEKNKKEILLKGSKSVKNGYTLKNSKNPKEYFALNEWF